MKKFVKIKKEITFIWSFNNTHKQIYIPIAEEAERRGYKVKFSDDVFEKCEIGFYCDHYNSPENSKFSVIMLHDITQGYSRWPDLWFVEPWNKYDVGILPGEIWVNNWKQCSHFFYARPRIGMYCMGWPKADKYAQINKKELRERYCDIYGLDLQKKTVLYAPSWENDNKQDDFVQAMMKLDVNILVKQTPAVFSFPKIMENVKAMEALHKDNPRVVMLDIKSNIFEAIAVSDILVSEESSTMLEAILMDIPAVSVTDWLIPDTVPSRYPKDTYEFTVKTTKNNLSSCIDNVVKNYYQYQQSAEQYRKKNFGELGHSAKDIMDMLDVVIEGKKYNKDLIIPNTLVPASVKTKVKFDLGCLKRYISSNICQRNKFFGLILKIYKTIRYGKDFVGLE